MEPGVVESSLCVLWWSNNRRHRQNTPLLRASPFEGCKENKGRFKGTDVELVIVKRLIWKPHVIGVGAGCVSVITVCDNLFHTFTLQQ